MNQVTPIDSNQQRLVTEETRRFIRAGEAIFARPFADIPVVFDLRGRASGMYRVRGRERQIRYNPWLFARYYEDCLTSTVPHEVAHYLADVMFGLRNIRPHGREWQAIMAAFGADASVTADYSLDGIPLRQTRKYGYRCGCDTHWLGVVRDRRVRAGKAQYRCRRCGETLQPV